MADILIVDDDRAVATAFQQLLGFEGHDCRLASSAQDAVQLIGERKPNLVMMDVRMPGVDGLQALEQIRADFPDVYVVIMTAYGSSQTSIDAIRNGVVVFIGRFASTSASPCASKWTTLPRRATSVTAPERSFAAMWL